ncbi:MAG TPA: helix-turn-helix transcriptional regulator [Ktedonobacteraceae bacterium]|jgi:transcriptional regulator with XRE-family HTH domain|nr:helix-turn-helix transcriptional regulator [Ktedonobacteraceae bacterium]
MNTSELQQLKMAWLAAEEMGDTQAQLALLRDHPDAQDALIDFIAAYHVAAPSQEDAVLPLTRRAYATAMERVFGDAQAAANLKELRAMRGLTLAQAARGLRLGVDVWKKFEDGVIELVSLSERQLERLAQFFEVSGEQFGRMLNNSQAVMTMNRRQTAQAARSEQAPKKQSFAEAIEKSTMPKEDKKEWLKG